jgi:hypothetical protein
MRLRILAHAILNLALVVKVRAGARSATEGRLAVDVAFPPPLRRMDRRTGAFHDPANRQAAPDNLMVVGIAVPVNHGGAYCRTHATRLPSFRRLNRCRIRVASPPPGVFLFLPVPELSRSKDTGAPPGTLWFVRT